MTSRKVLCILCGIIHKLVSVEIVQRKPVSFIFPFCMSVHWIFILHLVLCVNFFLSSSNRSFKNCCAFPSPLSELPGCSLSFLGIQCLLMNPLNSVSHLRIFSFTSSFLLPPPPPHTFPSISPGCSFCFGGIKSLIMYTSSMSIVSFTSSSLLPPPPNP